VKNDCVVNVFIMHLPGTNLPSLSMVWSRKQNAIAHQTATLHNVECKVAFCKRTRCILL